MTIQVWDTLPWGRLPPPPFPLYRRYILTMLIETREEQLFQVSSGGLSETSNKQVILNPFKNNIKMKEYMNIEAGQTLYPGVECPPLLQDNLYFVYRDKIEKNISSILLNDFQKPQITRLVSIPFIITKNEIVH